MRICVLALGLIGAAGLCGQHRFSWQEACFNNPSAPYCQGHEYFGKHPAKPAKDGTSQGVGTVPSTFEDEEETPSVIVAGGIDWRFADPAADAIAGFNFSGLAASPVGRSLIAKLGANQGLTESDMQKAFSRLCGVDQVVLSVRNDRIVAMVIGGAAASTLPWLEAGWKAVQVSQNAMLIGHADAVDGAVERIAMKIPPAELAHWTEQRQVNGEFWAVGSAGFIGPQAVNAGVQRFSLAFSMRNRVKTDLVFEFEGVPNRDALRLWPTSGDVAVQGNAFHFTMPIPADELQQRFSQIAGGPLGQRLAVLVNVARYLPVGDTTVPSQGKPVIYGLEDGPKVVNQD